MANDTFVKDGSCKVRTGSGAIIRYLDHIQEKYGTITFLVSEASRNYYNAKQILKVTSETPRRRCLVFSRSTDEAGLRDQRWYPIHSDNNAMTIFITLSRARQGGQLSQSDWRWANVESVKTLMLEYRLRYHRDVYFLRSHGTLVPTVWAINRTRSLRCPVYNSPEAVRSGSRPNR